jgi:hypothetical protein
MFRFIVWVVFTLITALIYLKLSSGVCHNPVISTPIPSGGIQKSNDNQGNCEEEKCLS